MPVVILCVSVCMSVIAWERICTFAKLQCISDIFIILLVFWYEKFYRGKLHMLFNFG